MKIDKMKTVLQEKPTNDFETVKDTLFKN